MGRGWTLLAAYSWIAALQRNPSPACLSALTESQDICLHLKPLVPQIEAFESADLTDVDVLLRPLVHTVCLIWANSRYYSTPGRIIVLLQEICNMFIQTVRRAAADAAAAAGGGGGSGGVCVGECVCGAGRGEGCKEAVSWMLARNLSLVTGYAGS